MVEACHYFRAEITNYTQLTKLRPSGNCRLQHFYPAVRTYSTISAIPRIYAA
jgi:hypothetical protein